MSVASLSFCSHFAIGGMSPELDSFRALGLRLLVQLIITDRWQRNEVLLGLGNWRRPPAWNWTPRTTRGLPLFLPQFLPRFRFLCLSSSSSSSVAFFQGMP